MPKHISLFILFAIVAVPTLQRIAQGEDEEYAPRTLIRKPFPAIKNLKHYPADADKVDVADEELVIGVEIGDESRAYPINMLKGPQREIVNDILDGENIAATW